MNIICIDIYFEWRKLDILKEYEKSCHVCFDENLK